MHVVLAAVSSSPYRNAVLQTAGQLAQLLDGKVRLAMLAQLRHVEDEAGGAVGEEAGLLEREAREVAKELGRREDYAISHETVWVRDEPLRGLVRELACADIGVVGKSLREEPGGGAAIASEVLRLKQLATKPLVIVPLQVPPIRRVLFVYTEHPESGHALSLAEPLSNKGVQITIVTLISPLGRTELLPGGVGYLETHGVPFESVEADCESCTAEGGPIGEILHLVKQEQIDLVLMGGTRRGLIGRLLWPELAREVVWNATVPVLVWY